jgi:hypothetical protein
MGNGYFRELNGPGHSTAPSSVESAIILEQYLRLPTLPALACRGVTIAFYLLYCTNI